LIGVDLIRECPQECSPMFGRDGLQDFGQPV
jgi:hypothetical protein